MKLFDQLKKITSKSDFIMSSTSIDSASKFNAKVIGLKEEFDQKYHENVVSGSSEKLKEYTFLAILGQGAFGLVVICHLSSLSRRFFYAFCF
jgi:Cys-tRNA synthase (O-phospho-L-seryl-tRNA:Cys-tRNA synthase)